MALCLALAALVLIRILPPAVMYGPTSAVVLLTAVWLVLSPDGWTARTFSLARLIAEDCLDQSLQLFLRLRETRKRGRSGRGTTDGGS
jgi:hypothetical protein